jgi:predicted patatin/cPLA2 family phospholipase
MWVPALRGAWGGVHSESFQVDIAEAYLQEEPGTFAKDENGLPIYNSLALSGGGANGAFGAGFLAGWSEGDSRPRFKLVSGVSTGALIAPFAFLGADYDDELEAVFTSIDSEDIFARYSLFKLLSKPESLGSMAPLQKLITENFNTDFIQAVASKHNAGFRLYIGTYHMDAQRLVVWNMGKIANSPNPGAGDLFRKVILASASIPIVFPPVLVEVEVDGQKFDEMHVDGGLAAQLFFYGGVIDLDAAAKQVLGGEEGIYGQSGTLYIVRNGKFLPEPVQIDRKLGEITAQTVDAMIRSSAKGDLYRLVSFANNGNFDLQYVAIPQDYISHSTEAFDSQEMRRLFDLGYEMGLSGLAWQSDIPGVEISAH